MKKLYASKRLVRGIHTPYPIPLTISYKNHQKSLPYFSHLAPFVLFTKRQSQKGGPWHNAPPPKYAPVREGHDPPGNFHIPMCLNKLCCIYRSWQAIRCFRLQNHLSAYRVVQAYTVFYVPLLLINLAKMS